MKTVVKYVIVLLLLVLFSVNACAQTSDAYVQEQLDASGGTALWERLDEETKALFERVGVAKLSDLVETLTDNKCKKIASVLKNFSFTVTGTTGYANSQVTAGGLDTTQFSPETMESFSNKRLYAVGEILDIDGDCGGFNLQWAWSSAMCAADSILNKE